MTDTTLPAVDHGAMLKGEIAHLDKEIRERQREIEILQDQIDDLKIERSDLTNELELHEES
jgi:septal ring factor EnvC (AmiA/AmiB activator)